MKAPDNLNRRKGVGFFFLLGMTIWPAVLVLGGCTPGTCRRLASQAGDFCTRESDTNWFYLHSWARF